MLSLYYLFLWDPYKNAGQPPTQIPHAQKNSPATPLPSTSTTPSSKIGPAPSKTGSASSKLGPAPQQLSHSSSTLSDQALDNIVEDLNNGAQPKALALAMKALSEREQERQRHFFQANPYKYISEGKSKVVQPRTVVKIRNSLKNRAKH